MTISVQLGDLHARRTQARADTASLLAEHSPGVAMCLPQRTSGAPLGRRLTKGSSTRLVAIVGELRARKCRQEKVQNRRQQDNNYC